MNINKTLGCLVSCILFSTSSSALTIMSDSANSTEGLGSFSMDVNWDGSDLTIDLTNTSDPLNGGYLSGFLLELPTGSTFSSAWTTSNLTALMPDNGPYAGSPYGFYDYGSALGGDFLGGGNPTYGIDIGHTEQFIFSGWLNVAGLSTEDFIADLTTVDPLDSSVLVRFRGFDDGGSDKVPGIIVPPNDPPDEPPILPPPPPPNVEVPTPSVPLLFAAGLAVMGWRRKG